jgi:mannose-6-phosphate isomerase-like protein (cupin superfamily)
MDFLKCLPETESVPEDLSSKIPIYYQPKKVVKPWGFELWVHNSYKYCGKLLVYTKPTKSSFHFHIQKTETFIVLAGSFNIMTRDPESAKESIQKIGVGDCVHLNIGVAHQIENIGDYGVLSEYSTEHFDVDSIRIFPSENN